ncbi:hypothetical protein [Streptomyces sp. B27]|uniref:hypothetical protein n=1 Tax=Streptomyces sp. B27 TaxID=2485015 RepID=UPI0013E35228|nr:hypothetical protein [Streptomyces sp. B27]
MLSYTTITPDEARQIIDRLAPYLPANLKGLEARQQGPGLDYTFDPPFTGREKEPTAPSLRDDPRLCYVSEDQDPAEHRLRDKARQLLDYVYEEAFRLWKDAAYIADLRDEAKEAPARWAAYQKAFTALESAAAYLRTPQAHTEWLPAVARLVDAQLVLAAAADQFDEVGERIARTHYKHLYSDLSHAEALTAAGYPESGTWHISEIQDYERSGHSAWTPCPPLSEVVRRLVTAQEEHLDTVRRLTGTDN